MAKLRQSIPTRLPLALAVAACLYGPGLYAQSAEPAASEEQTEEKKDGTKTLDKVNVTGSLLSRLGFDSISPVQVITADTSATVGQLDTASILQTTSVASGSTQFSNQFSGFVIEGGNGVQSVGLRGLDAKRTLILLDGRRPGPAGTRGQVGAFDLNVIPSIILQRAEILKDGGGSIYGSDAVAGVVNLITRKNIDKTELVVDTELPFESGGSSYSVSGATGWNFDNGSIVAAFQWYDQEPLRVGDRDFFRCPRDLVTDSQGNLLDREDRSITAGTDLEGCSPLYHNTVIDFSTGRRYVPSPDGVTIGPFPGYRPRANRNAVPGVSPAYYEDVLNADFLDNQHIFAGQERLSLFASADFSFDRVDWSGQFLYTSRETESRRFRQFFPTIDARPYGLAGRALPVMPFRSDNNTDVDFYYLSSSFRGGFGSESSWSWNVDTTFSRSEGKYSQLSIIADRTGDFFRDPDRTLPFNYFLPQYLNGTAMDELQAAVGEWHTGNTIYDQFVTNATATGELFELPAGAVGAAFGTEFRHIRIDDNPSDFERGGNLWGQSSATGTEGKDYIYELFGEIEVPILAGVPGFERLTFNTSGRVFKYDTTPDSDHVWKAGLLWQIVPAVSLRATKSTSYRAPGLYELFLGDQTSFVGQLAIDPCIDWGSSTNPNIRANCAADGIPDDYTGAGSSATIITGGGFGVLKPETSKTFTGGVVFTPAFANVSASLDYFKIDVRDTIDQLGAGAIVGGCYGLPVYPNAFCGLFERESASGTFPYNITTVRDSYINVNQLLVRGYDLNLRWDGEFSFGKLEVEGQFTYTMEDLELLFDAGEESGFETNDRNGTVSRPELVGNVRTALNRGDWTYTWEMRYIDQTENFEVDTTAPYFGNLDAVRDNVAESRLYHSFSVMYKADDWSALVGVSNVFDKEPPTLSAGAGSTLYGNVPAFATQYDWYGRSMFARLTYRF